MGRSIGTGVRSTMTKTVVAAVFIDVTPTGAAVAAGATPSGAGGVASSAPPPAVEMPRAPIAPPIDTSPAIGGMPGHI
jgi:hypothetical protein